MRSPLGVFLGVLNAARTAVNVALTGTSLTIQRASISIAVLGNNTVIAAPGAGLRIYIIHLSIQNMSNADTTVILMDGVAAINGLGYVFGPRGNYTFDAPGGPGMGEIALTAATDFIINLSGANQHSGTVVYRVGA